MYRHLKDPNNLPHKALIKLGDETLRLDVRAIKDEDGNYLGPMVAWSVVTAEMRLADGCGAAVDSVSSTAAEMEASAKDLRATADKTNQQSASAAAAAEQTSVNTTLVAAASDELSASVEEVGR